jgi:hypothetical protein
MIISSFGLKGTTTTEVTSLTSIPELALSHQNPISKYGMLPMAIRESFIAKVFHDSFNNLLRLHTFGISLRFIRHVLHCENI